MFFIGLSFVESSTGTGAPLGVRWIDEAARAGDVAGAPA